MGTTDWSDASFLVGKPVRKPKGYPFDGIIRAVFPNGAGEWRVVAELDRGNESDMLHIFAPSQLELVTEHGD